MFGSWKNASKKQRICLLFFFSLFCKHMFMATGREAYCLTQHGWSSVTLLRILIILTDC